MVRAKPFVRACAVALSTAWAAFACGGDTTKPDGASGVVSMSLSAATLSVGVGATAQLVPLARAADGALVSDMTGLQWTSANPSIATVDASGHIRGLAIGGPLTITASLDGVSATASVTVTPESIIISPNIASVAAGQSVQFSAVAYDAAGSVLNAGPTSWSVSAPGTGLIATITSSGTFTAYQAAPITVYATIAGKRGELTVGIPGTYDGLWIGTGTGSIQIQIQVRYGWITSFRLPSIPIQLCTTLQVSSTPNVPITNDAFTFAVPGGIPGTNSGVTGTFGANGALTGTIGSISMGQVTCDDGQVRPGFLSVTPGAYSATRAVNY